MKEKFYITTSLPYVNDVPHIGFALEIIQADVIARYQKSMGNDVYFLTGTDEHGSKIVKTAKAKEISTKTFVNQNSKKFKNLKKVLNLSWNNFIRTTDQKNHWPGVKKIWQAMIESGDLYKRTYQGLYCSGCEAFLTDKDMENGKCIIHKKEPELVQEENYFFRLSAYTKVLKNKINSGELEIIPESKRNEILSLMEKGLEDVSFSRSSNKLKWGIPVPGDETQTLYVWADALTNYISAIGYGRDEKEFEYWWPADVHVIGKDILRFHSAIWPAMLLSAKLPLPKKLFVHGFINVDGQKMSKSIGNVIYPENLVAKYSTDALRYYFLREISPFEDGDYSENKFIDRFNSDLANGLGNFYARVLGIVQKNQPVKNDYKMMDLVVEQKIKTINKSIEDNMYLFRLNDAITDVWSLISFGDGYVNEKKPWSKENPEVENQKTIYNLLIILNAIGFFLAPFLPETSKIITKSLNMKGKIVKIKKSSNLFPRIEEKITLK